MRSLRRSRRTNAQARASKSAPSFSNRTGTAKPVPATQRPSGRSRARRKQSSGALTEAALPRRQAGNGGHIAMGADLYLHSEFDRHHRDWERKYDEAVKRRAACERNSPEYEAAQQTVSDCYAHMYERGYFRDSYNPSNLLWLFGLSWWEDVGPLLDTEDNLTPEQAARLLAMLDERVATFKANLALLSGESRDHFREKYTRFVLFLRSAIENGEAIGCSI
jgi:hypothetical protein